MINNSNMPAMPISFKQNEDLDLALSDPEHCNIPHGLGLTKREYFAGLAMQGLITKGYHDGEYDAARMSLEFADALLAELERTE